MRNRIQDTEHRIQGKQIKIRYFLFAKAMPGKPKLPGSEKYVESEHPRDPKGEWADKPDKKELVKKTPKHLITTIDERTVDNILQIYLDSIEGKKSPELIKYTSYELLCLIDYLEEYAKTNEGVYNSDFWRKLRLYGNKLKSGDSVSAIDHIIGLIHSGGESAKPGASGNFFDRLIAINEIENPEVADNIKTIYEEIKKIGNLLSKKDSEKLIKQRLLYKSLKKSLMAIKSLSSPKRKPYFNLKEFAIMKNIIIKKFLLKAISGKPHLSGGEKYKEEEHPRSPKGEWADKPKNMSLENAEIESINEGDNQVLNINLKDGSKVKGYYNTKYGGIEPPSVLLNEYNGQKINVFTPGHDKLSKLISLELHKRKSQNKTDKPEKNQIRTKEKISYRIKEFLKDPYYIIFEWDEKKKAYYVWKRGAREHNALGWNEYAKSSETYLNNLVKKDKYATFKKVKVPLTTNR